MDIILKAYVTSFCRLHLWCQVIIAIARLSSVTAYIPAIRTDLIELVSEAVRLSMERIQRIAAHLGSPQQTQGSQVGTHLSLGLCRAACKTCIFQAGLMMQVSMQTTAGFSAEASFKVAVLGVAEARQHADSRLYSRLL